MRILVCMIANANSGGLDELINNFMQILVATFMFNYKPRVRN